MTHPVSARARAIAPNPLRALFPIAAREGMVSLANGHPSPDACDVEGLREAAALASGDAMAWRYGTTPGDPELREALAQLSGDDPDAVIVTSGAQQGIDLAVRALADPDDAIGVPAAIYPAVLSVLAANGARPVALGEDGEGVTPEALKGALAGGLSALYLTPTFGNPTGTVMGVERRHAILRLCAGAGVPVVEDDPYRDLWFETPPPPSMWQMAEREGATVVALRSASKIVAPGLRLGWTLAPPPLRGGIVALKQASDLQASGLAQRTLVRYLASGRLDAWLPRVRALYRGRHDALVAGLRGNGLDARPVSGGMFVWLRLPDEADPAALFDRAVERGTLFAPGHGFAAGPEVALEPHARLCFVTQNEAGIAQACERLGMALADVRAG